MRRFLIFCIGLTLPINALAITGDAARFDFQADMPAVVDDTTSTCNQTATVLYDFPIGIPGTTFDTTATCTAVVVATGGVPTNFKLKADAVTIKGGSFIIK